MKHLLLVLLLVAAACSSSNHKPVAPPPASPATGATPPALSRTNPNIVEETETYYIERLPKSEYVRVDDRHVKHPMLGSRVEFFKEDDQYYYISVQKALPEEVAATRQEEKTRQDRGTVPKPRSANAEPPIPLSDFEDLSPPRVAGRLKLEEFKGSGLPEKGMWRASFVIADVNGDGIPDIVSPPSRIGDGKLHVWIGDGKGHFTPWPMTFTDNGKPVERLSIDYGGVAVGDIDGDGKMDIVTASHTAGLAAFFGDGNGGFAVAGSGLPKGGFSAQAIVLLDADGDGRLDIVASRDILNTEANPGRVDKMQVRVYLFLGRDQGWEHKKEGLVGGFYSNALHAWDFDGDGKKDVLTGSNYVGALTLLWKNMGDGSFSPVSFPAIEGYSYHLVTAPGTFGANHDSAFVDAFQMHTSIPQPARAGGLSLYSFRNGEWTRHRLWRKKDPKTSIFALAMGDLDGDGLDDVVFADGELRRIRVLFQQPDGSFVEAAENEEPSIDSPGQCIRLADLNGDGRLDIVLSKTVTTADPRDPGGWNVYLSRR